MNSVIFSSTLILIVATVGIGLLLQAPLLGLGLFLMAAGAAYRVTTKGKDR